MLKKSIVAFVALAAIGYSVFRFAPGFAAKTIAAIMTSVTTNSFSKVSDEELGKLIAGYEQKVFQENTKDSIQYLEQFKSDLSLLSKLDVFRPLTVSQLPVEKDASTYLNPHLTWEGSKSQPAPGDEFGLPKEWKEKLKGWHWDWVKHHDEAVAGKFNFQFLKDLSKYEYWALDKHSPMADAIEAKVQWHLLPIPNYSLFQTWAKLRFLTVNNQTEALVAVNEVRHLMRLIYTNESLVSNMVVVALLGIEMQITDYWRVAKGYRIEWQPTTPELRTAAKRALYAWPAFFDFSTPEEVWTATFSNSSSLPGACAGAKEKSFSNSIARAFLLEHYPERFKRLDLATATLKDSCRMTPLAFQGQTKEEMLKWIDDNVVSITISQEEKLALSSVGISEKLDRRFFEATGTKAALMRKFAGLGFHAIAVPSFFKAYKEPEDMSKYAAHVKELTPVRDPAQKR